MPLAWGRHFIFPYGAEDTSPRRVNCTLHGEIEQRQHYQHDDQEEIVVAGGGNQVSQELRYTVEAL